MYFDENDTQNVPVKTNDVVFGLHAVFACIVTIIQCFIYEVCILILSIFKAKFYASLASLLITKYHYCFREVVKEFPFRVLAP